MIKKLSHKLSVFALAMLNVGIVMNLRGLPLMAKEGLTMIFYILFSALLFLLPVSLVSAELATGWPEGGIYRWVKTAFGSKLGFTAIWLQWIQNTIWYSTTLAFAAGALAYFFLDPAISNNKVFIIIVIAVIYWSATFINFHGMKTASWITSIFVIGGTIFPAIIMILLGIVWIAQGNSLEFLNVSHKLLPDFKNFDNISFLAGIILLFSGMEVGAVHASEMNNPKKDYPKSIFLAIFTIVITFLLGSFAIAIALPPDKISLTSGTMESEVDPLGWTTF